MNRKLTALLFLVLLAAAAFGQSSKPPAAPTAPVLPSMPKISGEPTLAAARSALAKMIGKEAFGNYLETYALALPLHDAVALCREFLPKAAAAQLADLAAFAGSIALLAGRYDDAASLYSRGSTVSSGIHPDLNLKAARCYLAAGNTVAAKTQLDLVPNDAEGESWEPARQLALSWLYLFEGEPEKAFILLQPFVSEKSGQGSRREALFLLWLAARSPEFAEFKVSTKGLDARSLETMLQIEYPGSMEQALTRKEVFAKPASWLLAALYAPSRAATGMTGGERSLAKPEAPKAQSAGSESSMTQLQVGWFSRRENATALTAKLVKLGFSAKTDEQKTKEGELRWAVIVDASGDWSKTQAKLKDLGYESYLLP